MKKSISIALFVFCIFSSASGQEVLSDELKEFFKKSILSKVKRLEHYITLIADKSKDEELRKSSINQVIDLFENENKIVQISFFQNGKEKIISRSVRTYFDRLFAIKADRVDVTFYEAIQLTDVRLGPDKKYYATAYIFQDTKIYYNSSNDIPDYSARTEKAIDISIKPDSILIGDKKIVLYPAKLGNINVKETHPSK